MHTHTHLQAAIGARRRPGEARPFCEFLQNHYVEMYFQVFKAGSEHFNYLLEIYHAFDATDKS